MSLFAWKINNFSLRCNPTRNWNHSTHHTIRRQMPRVPGLQTWGFMKICSTRCPWKMFSFSSKQGNLLKWLNFTHTALSIQINFYSRLKSHACFPHVITNSSAFYNDWKPCFSVKALKALNPLLLGFSCWSLHWLLLLKKQNKNYSLLLKEQHI